jgi:DNA (cytosine-5)-methyltransferase 3A
MNVLSLFDGISAGRVALERAGVVIDKYYASEVDTHAIKVSSKNYPDIIQLGDVTKWKEWDIDWSTIDLVIGGSPCQGFSFAGKQLNFEDPRSKLFFDFVDICHRVIDSNPKMKFLLENVRMKKEYQDVISSYMGVSPIMINSCLLSAQNRVRFYWTNIPNLSQPEDKGILLKDIIQKEIGFDMVNTYTPKDFKEDSLCHHIGDADNINGNDCIKRVYAESGKSPALNTMQGGNRHPKISFSNKRVSKCTENNQSDINEECIIDSYNNRIYKDKSPTITTRVDASNLIHLVKRDDRNVLIVSEATKKGYVEVNTDEGVDLTFINLKTRRGRLMKEKSNCLTATNYEYCFFNGFVYRKLTPVECERLQTFPDNYTDGVSNSQRYKALGNSWTVDVIAHIFNGLNNEGA